MTSEELIAREQIRHTLSCYTVAGDELRADGFLAVFAEDAVFEVPGRFRYEGRRAIGQWATAWFEAGARGEPSEAPRPAHVRHHIGTCRIELTGPAAARALTYWIVYTDVGPDHSGRYLDAFTKAGHEWLISHRQIVTDWRSPNSRYARG